MARALMWGLGLSLLGLVSVAALSAGPNTLFFVGPEGEEQIRARFPGSGTQQDPFVIAHLSIDAEGSDYGVWLENLDAWITLEQIEIRGAAESDAVGAIFVRNCTHVTIRNCHLHDNRIGIVAERCSGLRVENNLIENNMYGIVLGFLSHGNVITGNRFDNVYNAKAQSSNQWSEQGQGNCWSDLGGFASYWIAPNNTDPHPLSLATCPQPADTAPPVIHIPQEPIVIRLGNSICAALAERVSAYDDRDGSVAWSSDCADGDSREVGVRTIGVSACDAAGNCAHQDVQVSVQDQIPPQISLLGDSPLHLADCEEFVDPGAQSIDAYCGPCEVNTRIVRTQDGYRVTYESCDRYGNCAQAFRTVIVRDVTAPVLTMWGDNPAVVRAGEPYVDPGAIAADACDGELPVSVVRSTVETARPGTYVIEYEVCDSAGNCVRAERLVEVVDGVPPEISLVGRNPDVVEASFAYADPGALAMDLIDGACTVSVDSSALDAYILGTFDIVYTACDLSGNCSSRVRHVVRRDTLPPEISILGEPKLFLEAAQSHADPGATATDLWDGLVSVESDWLAIDFAHPGEHVVTYSSSDRSGNLATRTRFVHVRDTIPPEIALAGSGILLVSVGEPVGCWSDGLRAVDAVDGDVSDRIECLLANVNTGEPGIYAMQYIACDEAGNCSNPFERTVLVGMPLLPASTTQSGTTLDLQGFDVIENTVAIRLQARGLDVGSSHTLAILVGDLLGSWLAQFPATLSMSIIGDVDDASGTPLMKFWIAEEDVVSASEEPPIGFLQFASIDYLGQALGGVDYDAMSVRECVLRAAKMALGDDLQPIAQVTPMLSETRTIYQVRISYAETLDPDVSAARIRIETSCLRLSKIVAALVPGASISITVHVDYYGLVYAGRYEADPQPSGKWDTTFLHPVLRAE